jgi:uncharacterized metal-binding protein YceD (DUF177 family)
MMDGIEQSARRERPWSVPVAVSEVPEAGRHFDLVADAATRQAIAAHAGLVGLPHLVASFDVTRQGRDGLRVIGQVTGTVEQTCVVTLEPMESEITEPIDLAFMPGSGPLPQAEEVEVPAEDAYEELVGGAVDLGAIATEFLVLGIDPYPRRPGAAFEAPETRQDEPAGPFAGLAALKRGQTPG